MPDKNQIQKVKFLFMGIGALVGAVVALVTFSSLEFSIKPLLLVVTFGVLIIAYIRLIIYFGPKTERAGLILLTSGILAFAFLQYNGHKRLDEVQTFIAQFNHPVTFHRNSIPVPRFSRVYFNGQANDKAVKDILSFPHMSKVTEVYLDSHDISDKSLTIVDRLGSLRYVFIHSDNVTEAAVEKLEIHNPQALIVHHKGSP